MSRNVLFQTGPQDLVVKKIDLPALPSDRVRVSVKAVGINPMDYMLVGFGFAIGMAVGCDYAGVVTEVGSDVKNVSVGDQVGGSLSVYDRKNPEYGAYADSVDARADTLLRFKNLTDKAGPIGAGPVTTFAQAATVGVVVLTSALSFVLESSTPLKPNSKSGLALVYGGGAAVGFATAQIAKYIGYEVIVVASEKHHKFYSELGFKHMLDYHDKEWPQKAKAIGDITWAFGAIDAKEARDEIVSAVSDKNPVTLVCATHVTEKPSKANVELKCVNGFMWTEVRREMGPWVAEVDPKFHEGTVENFKDINNFLDGYVNFPVETLNGLDSVSAAFDKAKTVSGEKVAVIV